MRNGSANRRTLNPYRENTKNSTHVFLGKGEGGQVGEMGSVGGLAGRPAESTS